MANSLHISRKKISSRNKTRHHSSRKKSRRIMRDSSVNSHNKHVVQLPIYALCLFKKCRYKVLYGGRGAARSWSVARALLLRAAKSRLRILCTREMQSSLRDSVHQLLRDQIELMGIPGYRVMEREIRHVNGSLFLFEGLRHNVQKIKSLEGIDICWVEEAERISKESWDVLIPTIRKDGSEIWITFNPDLENDNTYVRFVKRKPNDAIILHVNWNDNPWLTDVLREEKDYAYSIDPESADHIWGGELRKVSDAQILRHKWVIQEFIVPFIEDANHQRIPLWDGPYQGMDFGFANDPFAAVRCWVHERTLYVEYELFKLHLEIDHATAACIDAIPAFERYTTRADSSRPDSISFLSRHGLARIVPCVKHPNSVEDGIAHLRSYEQIIINPRCKNVIDECKRYSYKVDPRSGDILPIVVDKHNHGIDALRYALQPLIKPHQAPSFIFPGGEVRQACPMCSSFLPDDGVCVQCGDDSVAIERAEEIEALQNSNNAPGMDAIRERVRALTNGNGNGSHAADVDDTMSRLRGINS